jgi:hypothetical protein
MGRAVRKQNWRGDSEPEGIAVSGERGAGSWHAAVGDRKAVKRASKQQGHYSTQWGSD